MSNSLGERLKIVRGKRSQDEFSQLVEININTLRGYEQGSRSPNADTIVGICKKTNTSPNWLLFGEGPMRRGETAPEAAQTKAQPQPPPAPPPEDEFKISDMLTKAAEILESNTIHRTALASNIISLHQAVRSEQLVARLDERMAQVEQRMGDLEKENQELKQHKSEQLSQSKAVGA